ncbi:hypothetical protein TNCV_2426231 [Trichonephila clavipes]|nr:hypothetical protein TNCV_2426231 [Trichonephila clavipes]
MVYYYGTTHQNVTNCSIQGLENCPRLFRSSPIGRPYVHALFGKRRRYNLFTDFTSKDVKATAKDAVRTLVNGIYLNQSPMYSNVFEQNGMPNLRHKNLSTN